MTPATMDVAEQVLAIQKSYPRIFHACHTLHARRGTTEFELSPSDSNVLSHLDARRGTRPGELAAHMGLSASTLSAAIARLGAVLGNLGPKERAAAVHGLEALARGAATLLAEQASATRWSRPRSRIARR